MPQQPRKERNEAIFQQQCRCHPGQTGAVGPIGENPPEINSKKSGKLTDHTYTCSSLTNFGHKLHPFTGNRNTEYCFEVTLNKLK